MAAGVESINIATYNFAIHDTMVNDQSDNSVRSADESKNYVFYAYFINMPYI